MTTVQVVCAVLWEEGRILITRRPPEVHLGGFWEFPGGKVTILETPEEALHREMAEELGVRIRVVKKLDSVCHTYAEHRDQTLLLEFFLCHRIAGEPKPLRATEMRWVEPVKLGEYPFPPADQEFLQKLPHLL